MKGDFRVHLEEGPYSLYWLNRTAESLQAAEDRGSGRGSRAWAKAAVQCLAARLSKGPFSREWLELYRRQAKKAGLDTVCITENLYRFVEGKPYYEKYLQLADNRLGQAQRRWLEEVACDSLPAYVSFLQEERLRWAEEGICLRMGIVLDFFPRGGDELARVTGEAPWDICIGAVRFPRGLGLSIPEAKDQLQRMDRRALYSLYFDWLEQAIQCKQFDLVAHADGLQSFGFMQDETMLLPYYQRMARALRRWDVATELNTSLYAGSYNRAKGLSQRCLEIFAHHGVAVTIGSNAHYPEQVGQHWAEATAELRRAGFRTTASFAQRQRTLVTFA